jgi:methylglyoxal synthase
VAKTLKKEKRVQTVALVAHDGKKAEMVEFVKDNWEFLSGYRLIATQTTGKLIQRTGLKVLKKLSGPQGGDAQIAAAVAEGKCDAVIFLRDPLGNHPHDPDISSLLRICDVHNVPLATNFASAKLVVVGLSRQL